MLGMVPLLIIPFLLYNLGLAGLFGGAAADPFATAIFSADHDVRRRLRACRSAISSSLSPWCYCSSR